jgi:MFS family permease
MWLTLAQIAVPLGIVIGYGSTAVLVSNYSWRWSFYIQVFLFIPIALLFLLYPNSYFDRSSVKNLVGIEHKHNTTLSLENDDLFREGETGNPPRTSVTSLRREQQYKKLNQFQGMKILLKDKIYFLLTISAS